MKYLQLMIQYAPDHQRPMHRFMTESDAIEREWLVTWNSGIEDGISYTMFYVIGERDPYENALSTVETMESYDLTPVREGAFYAVVCGRETEQSRRFYSAFQQPTLMIVPPIAYRPHGIMAFDVVGEPEVLERVLNRLPEGITAEVSKVGEYDVQPGIPATDITSRQREAVRAALDAGYYEFPRAGSIADVADALGCATSTASDHLQKAEGRLMRRFIGE